MKNQSAADESVLISKVEALLREGDDRPNYGDPVSPSSFSIDERTLTALVLLSRLSQDHDYLKFWREHQERFCLFCTHWISDDEDGWLSLRWATVWIQRLLAAADDKGTSCKGPLESMRNLLWERLLSMEFTPDVEHVRARMEVVDCLLSMEEILPTYYNADIIDLDVRLDSLWRQIEGQEDSRQNIVQHDTYKDATKSAQGMMNATLQELLVTSSDDNNTMPSKRWETCAEELLLQQSKRYISCEGGEFLPSFWTRVLKMWWSKRSTKTSSNDETQRRYKWTSVLLKLLIHACEERQTVKNVDCLSFWSLDSRWECWTRLTMSSLAVDDASLRSLAWTCAAHVIEKSSWRVILNLDTTSTWMTTVMRLAVGEAKIQLGWVVSSDEAPSEERQFLVRATCRILIQCIDLIQELTESRGSDNDSGSVLPAAFIQSLHRSLEEAFDMTVQYLNLTERQVPAVDAAVIQVFGHLLTEFDVFLRQQQSRQYDLPNEQFGNDDQEDSAALLALAAAVRMSPPPCRRELLLGLAAVLASAEGDKRRIESLKRTQLLGDPTIELLKACWKWPHNNETAVLAAACDAVGVLVDVSPVTPITELQTSILKWIRQACEADTIPNRVALDVSLAGYVKLQGDTPPPDSDAAILRRAYETLDPHDSEPQT